MKKNLIIIGAISLVLAVIITLLDMTKYEFLVGITTVKIYPTAFFGLLGIVLIVRGVWRNQTD